MAGGGDILAGAGSAGWQVDLAPGPEWSDCSVAAGYPPPKEVTVNKTHGMILLALGLSGSCVGRLYVYHQGKGR